MVFGTISLVFVFQFPRYLLNNGNPLQYSTHILQIEDGGHGAGDETAP